MPLATRIFRRFGSALDETMRARLVDFICDDASYRERWTRAKPPRILHYPLSSPRMRPRQGALAACALPSLATPGDIAAWLGISITELDWFADPGRLADRRDGPLVHYRYRWIPKRHGIRLVEIPKQRLRDFQRRILREILQQVPCHAAAHGFVRGRSCRSHAQVHAGRRAVLRMDLRDFFPSVSMARVAAIFRTLGYPDASATVLAAFCTHGTPRRAFAALPAGDLESLGLQGRARLERRHLPQGAPTSPTLANLAALMLDFRLDGLAKSLGLAYSRYADDLAFSGEGELLRNAGRLADTVASIAQDVGFEVNFRKTRLMPSSRRQALCGIVVNDRPMPLRPSFDRLKAILHNCARDGPGSQNREGRADFRRHLEGRVAHLRSIDARKAGKLLPLLARIDWTR